MSQLCFQFICELMVRGSSESNELKIAKAKLEFLKMLLACEENVGTLDDATKDLNEKFNDSGKWRGQVTLGLATDGVIAPIGATNSKRPSRNRGLLRVWALCDSVKARRTIERLERQIESKENPPAVAAASGISESDTSNHSDKDTKQCD